MKPPALRDEPFAFYSGGYMPARYAPIGAWVKYRKGPNEVKLLDIGPRHAHISCPDRELMLTRDALVTGGPRNFATEGWHEFVPFGWCNSPTKEHYPPQFMINYVAHVQGLQSPRMRAPGAVRADGRRIMSDSGGFQLGSGVVQWVNPVTLAEWYIDNVDEGMALDIPTGWYDSTPLADRAARVQAMNSRVMQKILPPEFPLFEAVHGRRIEDMLRYNKISAKGIKTDRVAIGSNNRIGLVPALYRFANLVLDKRFPRYQQYHMLGVYNIALLCPLIRFAALLRKKNVHQCTITTDATTAVQSGVNRTFHLQRVHYKAAERLKYLRIVGLSHPNPHRTIACSCPVCSTLRYADILAHVDSAIVAHAMISHNAIEIERWVNMMTAYAGTLDREEYAELSAKACESSADKNAAVHALNFVEDIFEHGIKEANRRSRLLLVGSLYDNPYYSLTAGHTDNDELLYGGEEASTPKNDFEKEMARLHDKVDAEGFTQFERNGMKILAGYEAFHKTGKEPEFKDAKSVRPVTGNSIAHGKNRTLDKKKTSAIVLKARSSGRIKTPLSEILMGG